MCRYTFLQILSHAHEALTWLFGVAPNHVTPRDFASAFPTDAKIAYVPRYWIWWKFSFAREMYVTYEIYPFSPPSFSSLERTEKRAPESFGFVRGHSKSWISMGFVPIFLGVYVYYRCFILYSSVGEYARAYIRIYVYIYIYIYIFALGELSALCSRWLLHVKYIIQDIETCFLATRRRKSVNHFLASRAYEEICFATCIFRILTLDTCRENWILLCRCMALILPTESFTLSEFQYVAM